MTAAVEFSHVSKTYSQSQKTEALHDISFSIEPGEFFGLLGMNGAGKSTLIHLLSGISFLKEGDIKVFGHCVQKEPMLTKRLLGVVPQDMAIDPFFSIDKMISFFTKMAGVIPDPEWIDYLFEALHLEPHRHKSAKQLSGGMKRRVMIMKALVHKPKVLILDEPTAGVDVELRHEIWNFISDLHQTGLTIILTTHYLEEAERFCNRIGILKKGQLVALTSKSELLKSGKRPKLVFEVGAISWSMEQKQRLEREGIEFQKGLSERCYLKKNYEAQDPSSMEKALHDLKLFCQGEALKVYGMESEVSSLEDVFLTIAH